MIAAKGENRQLSPSQYAMLYVARAGVEKDLHHTDMALVDLEEAISLDSSQPENIPDARRNLPRPKEERPCQMRFRESHIVRSTAI